VALTNPVDAVAKQITAGKPETLHAAATIFDNVRKDLQALEKHIRDGVKGLAGTKDWEGPAAEAFATAMNTFVGYITDSTEPLNNYKTELDNAGNALQTAITNITTYQSEVQTWMDKAGDQALFGLGVAAVGAQAILDALVKEYQRVENGLEDIPETPNDLIKKKADDNKHHKKNPHDKNPHDKNPHDKKNPPDKQDTPTNSGGDDPPKSGSGSPPSGGGDTPKSDLKSDGTPKSDLKSDGTPKSDLKSDGAPKSDLKSDGTPPPPLDGGPLGGGSKIGKAPLPPGSGEKGVPPPGAPLGSGGTPGKVTDKNKALPDAPLVNGDNGVQGFDVDGDGKPDIGLDGKPLPGAKLVQGKHGVWGVDVNGDGKPDIGLHGELLNYDALAKGPDGSLGIDINGDGKPDIGLSGQVLPDAPVVTKHGVQGIDVNGDGIPDIGMDGKPLPGAHTVTYHGVRGVDVNGDGKPDIGMDGSILKDAPIAQLPNGLKGVDVNCDGKPDIALHGGESVPVDRGSLAIPSPDLPPSPPTQPTTGAYLSSMGLGAPDPTNPPTTLTSLGAAPHTPVPSTVPPGVLMPGGGAAVAASGGVLGTQYVTAPGAMVGLGAIGSENSAERRSALKGDEEEEWQDAPEGSSALGRPAPRPGPRQYGYGGRPR
jgi:hypothetical protein